MSSLTKAAAMEPSGVDKASEVTWSNMQNRMKGGKYKDYAAFKKLVDNYLKISDKLSASTRTKIIDAAATKDKTTEPKLPADFDACAEHMAWAIVDAYYLFDGK